MINVKIPDEEKERMNFPVKIQNLNKLDAIHDNDNMLLYFFYSKYTLLNKYDALYLQYLFCLIFSLSKQTSASDRSLKKRYKAFITEQMCLKELGYPTLTTIAAIHSNVHPAVYIAV